MNNKEFKKGIKEFREIKLTTDEKSTMLENIFKAPMESPYFGERLISNWLHKPVAFALIAVLLVTGTSVAYTAENSVPGEALYTLKTGVFEPILDLVNTAPIEKLEWEEKKVARRIMEAEELAAKNQLDEKKTRELEQKIEKSSAAFAVAAEKVASSTATTTKGRSEEIEKFKKAFRQKLEEEKPAVITDEDEDEDKGRLEDEDDQEEKRKREEKIKKLKDRAVRALDKEEDDDERRENSKKGDWD